MSRQRANFALNAGNQLMLRGQIADAITRYQESVAADPTFAEAHTPSSPSPTSARAAPKKPPLNAPGQQTWRRHSRWIEPDNGNDSSYVQGESKSKNEIIAELLPQVFAWARAAHPTQPLTSGVWHGDWSSPATMTPVGRIEIEQSDVIGTCNYGWPQN